MTVALRGADEPLPFPAAVFVKPDHVGIVYLDENREPQNIHLLGHHRLTTEEGMPEGTTWVVPQLEEEQLSVVAGVCEMIRDCEDPNQVPFAFGFESAYVDSNGMVLMGETDHGLTCATFVLAVYSRAHLPLLKLETWEVRDEDEAHQRRCVQWLRRQGERTQAEAVDSEVGCFRYRPEEVAAASGFPPDDLPLPFSVAELAGRNLHSKL